MSLDDLYETLTADTDKWMEERRAEDAKIEKRFPGFPTYLSAETLEAIEKDIADEAGALHETLAHLFGQFAVKDLHPKKIEWWLRSLATRVAHRAAGHMVTEAVASAEQASRNMLNGTLAGIKIGQRQETPNP